jgi:hypothetical protein
MCCAAVQFCSCPIVFIISDVIYVVTVQCVCPGSSACPVSSFACTALVLPYSNDFMMAIANTFWIVRLSTARVLLNADGLRIQSHADLTLPLFQSGVSSSELSLSTTVTYSNRISLLRLASVTITVT